MSATESEAEIARLIKENKRLRAKLAQQTRRATMATRAAQALAFECFEALPEEEYEKLCQEIGMVSMLK